MVKSSKTSGVKKKVTAVPKVVVHKPKRKFIFDTDMGQDDAVAYLLCLQNLKQVDILAVTTVSGNHSVD